ncbi:hypothetical protein P4I81_05415 [Bacillus cereus]|uniref:hypothetical protein n=1 Tax=Bacillus cereus group TaxID=86661 RepID=UPI00044ECF4E|nr:MULTISPECIES: hypothetical protein [Bacillus cereus group]EXY05068.1 hypothetical protein BF15_04275 [Bacillus thuringiensis]MEB8632694.1 hypothetical protein [Bacillus cereus]MEB8745620.1 hypothetical protein [Bacillus cereus]MEB8799025.1 hypothetical protein [Bacillus cereus]MEB8914941.1 hypothetical protein [Bacillus cereus]
MHEPQEGRDMPSGMAKHKHQLPFQCIVSLPSGFQIEKPNDLKLVYDVSHLSMTKDTCKKRIEIDECGQVEIDLQVLKIKGVLSFIGNFSIEPILCENMYTTVNRDPSICLSFQDTVYVDHILKYSVLQLPYYVIDGEHIQVRDLQIKLMKENPQSAQISGLFCFVYE